MYPWSSVEVTVTLQGPSVAPVMLNRKHNWSVSVSTLTLTDPATLRVHTPLGSLTSEKTPVAWVHLRVKFSRVPVPFVSTLMSTVVRSATKSASDTVMFTQPSVTLVNSAVLVQASFVGGEYPYT